jgi:peptidoglycan/xylan/chitin deacetylase (PgdA/CDA1 family)
VRVKVTLTFDNGPTAGVTGRVLDVLGERGVLSTFFVIGARLREPAARKLVERASDEGHWIGNHTLDHRVPLGDLGEPGEVARQVDEAQELLGELAHPDRLFRPYGDGGVIDRRLLGSAGIEHIEQDGFTCVLWNALPGDWRDPDGWVDRGIAQVAAQPWSVVVLHDIATGALPRLGELLDRLGGELGAELTQELPEAVVPIRRGRRTGSFHLLEASGNLSAAPASPPRSTGAP